MGDDVKDIPKDERPSFLKEARQAKEELDAKIQEAKAEFERLKALKEEDILSGKAPASKPEPKPVEHPLDYLKSKTGIDLRKK